jgi:hypothetical protein
MASTSAKYQLPAFLEGQCTHAVYFKWLTNKADTLLKRDRKHGKPYAMDITKSMYKEKIHKAVVDSGQYDPYTGDLLKWELISTWDTSHEQPGGYKKQFSLMPTVDHIDPDMLEFEICSWQTNDCKAGLNPGEFVALCKKIANYRNTDAYIKKWMSMKKGEAGEKKYYA